MMERVIDDIRNPCYGNKEKTVINCEVRFTQIPDYLPFTARPDDVEEWGRDIFAQCIADKWGSVSEYVPPETDWLKKAEYQRQKLLTEANAATADWRTELQLGVITDEDKASLIKWMACIKELKALKLDGITDEAGYNAIVWPDKP